MWFNHQTFFSAYEKKFAPLSSPKLAGLDHLLGFVQLDSAVNDPRWVAYMLATVKHECADSWQPITERGSDAYFAKYEPGTKIGDSLGNTKVGDGPKYKGRGYVQITGRANYAKLGARLELGNGLIDEPERVLDPVTAYRIMSIGMREGLFTGKSLMSFINDSGADYLGARRIINRQDRAETIAGYATGIEKALTLALQ